MRVLIVGAGIAGLSFSAHLQKFGIRPKIIEKAKSFEHIGYVLGLWSKGFDTLAEFGVREKVEKLGYESSVFNIRNKEGKITKKLHFDHLIKKYGPVILLHRADFHELLQSLNKNVPIAFGISVEAIKQSESTVLVTFSNGEKEEFDVVVGADGIHSIVRNLVFGTSFLHYAGIHGWTYMVSPRFSFPKNASEIWAGGRFFGVYPDQSDKLCTIFAKKMDAHAYRYNNHADYLKKEFSDFGWIVPDVLSTMTDESTIYHSTWDEVTLDDWYKGRVVLTGDAAHSSVPATGMGGCMALEDARVLAEELAANETAIALKNYAEKRKDHVDMVQKQSEFIDFLINIESSFGMKLRDFLLRFIPSALIVRDFEYLLSG